MGKSSELIVSVKTNVWTLAGTAPVRPKPLTEMVVRSPESVMCGYDGVNTAVIGQTSELWARSSAVQIFTV